jgi:hypothetical protein
VSPRFAIFVCCALLLALASVALGTGGTYQHTKDGNTIVWNDYPKLGETADWSGKRDREGYATGFGTLIWYTVKGAEFARYFGNMVRGKFDGPVNVHSKGKTAHAFFVEGGRTTGWARGPAPSGGQTSASGPEGAVPRREVSTSETRPAEPQAPEETGPETTITSRSSLFAPGAVRPIEHVGQEPESVHKQTSKQAEAIAPRRSGRASTDDVLGGSKPVRENAQEENVSPPIEPTPLPMIAAPIPSARERKDVDDSLKSLVTPPSSLRSAPARETPSP